tara:strand:- start:21 stop:1091 length:1071 start_codon:yes stop_codon:yes gene_type:complete
MAFTTIDDPSAHFQALIYTGNATSRSLTNGGNSDLQPDLVWTKKRNEAQNHCVFDSSRGVSKIIFPDGDDAEASSPSVLTAFNSDGFSLSADALGNDNTDTYVAWQWKANGGTTTTNDASSTSVGTIDSVYQANTTAGFSIITWTGTGSAGTIAHGLGATPSVMIVKNRSKSAGESWMVYHHKNTSAPETDHLQLNTNNATSDNDVAWNDTAPTSTVFSVNNDDSTNDSGETFVGYFFKEIQGYSKFGSYTGNGNADGPFVYLGFKPKYFLLKNTAASQHWYVFDTARDTYNPSNSAMQVSGNAAQETGYDMDFVSNGFKIRHADNAWNGSGNVFVYMAFAEHPFVSSGGVPCTAR